METSYTIELMQLADLVAVCALETAAGMSTLGISGFSQRLAEPHHILLVARAPQLVGLFSGWVIVDELEIDNLVVAHDQQRQGIGAALLRTALQAAQAKGAQTALLEVRVSNATAQRLYATFGFTAVATRRDYYRDPKEDAIIMRCQQLNPD